MYYASSVRVSRPLLFPPTLSQWYITAPKYCKPGEGRDILLDNYTKNKLYNKILYIKSLYNKNIYNKYYIKNKYEENSTEIRFINIRLNNGI